MEKQKEMSVFPGIYFLGKILDLISNGKLHVPNFQRPFVWKPDDMIALFESIENGYPIGSLLFWKSEGNYKYLPNIGPYKVPNNKSSTLNLILDGHQRLSTLYGILSSSANKEILVHDNFWRWELYYDLKEKKFVHCRNIEPEPHFFKLNSLLKTLDFLKEVNRIHKKCTKNAEKYIERAEKLAQIFREYQIVVTEIEGGDLDNAVNIFFRLNSKGTPISEDRMYSALTYKEGESPFNLSERIDDILMKLDDYSFGGIKRISIFRNILAAAGKNIYTQGKLNIFDDNDLNIPKIVDKCEASLIKAVRFLKEDIRVPNDKFLPYNLQLIIISEFFRLLPKPNEEMKLKLQQWFWVTSFVGLDTSNSARMRQSVEEMQDFARIGNSEFEFEFKIVDFSEEALSFPSRYNSASARVRAYVLFLLSLDPKSLNGKKFNPDDALKEGYKALPYIISKGNQLSNRILLGNVKYGFPKKALKATKNLFENYQLTNDVLSSHAITQDAIDTLRNGKHDLFLELREKELIRLEREFMKEKGVVPNNNTNPEEPLIDTD